jgi:hypothetical protein
VVGTHQDFLISFDLHYALRNLRHEHQPRYVWIDTICINQLDVTERNSQVRLMRDVYTHAKSVCIWLGMPPSSAGDLTGAQIQDIGYDVVQHIASKADRNWWRRRWVVQEVATTAEPVILIGSLWLDFNPFIYHCIDHHMRLGPSDADLETVKEILAFSMLMITRTSFRRSLEGPDTLGLSFLLSMTVELHASEPHDAIYAVLGLIGDEAKQAVRVDYGMSFIDLYAEITQLLVEASSWGSAFPLDVVIDDCWRRLFLAEPSWILDFSQTSTHSGLWGRSDDHFNSPIMLEPDAGVRANDNTFTQGVRLSKLRDLVSQAGITMCGGHAIVKSANENELRASFNKDLRMMTCSGLVLGVIRNIIPVREHLLSVITESQRATVDERAIIIKLQCSASRLTIALRQFEDLHSSSVCDVDEMTVFVTTDGAIGMCYSTMNDGRPGFDVRSPVLDQVVCLYGARSPVLIRPLPGEHFCLLVPCMFMRDCECYVGQPHSAGAFQRMTLV